MTAGPESAVNNPAIRAHIQYIHKLFSKDRYVCHTSLHLERGRQRTKSHYSASSPRHAKPASPDSRSKARWADPRTSPAPQAPFRPLTVTEPALFPAYPVPLPPSSDTHLESSSWLPRRGTRQADQGISCQTGPTLQGDTDEHTVRYR